MTEDPGTITRALRRYAAETGRSLEEVYSVAYKDLLKVARREIRSLNQDGVWEGTEVVSEAFLRTGGSLRGSFENRHAFLGYMATLMRRAIIDVIRMRKTKKRGGGVEHVPFEDAFDCVAFREEPEKVLAIDRILKRYGEEDAESALFVELRFFTGLTWDEVADTMEVSKSKVMRKWRVARVWLSMRLKSQGDEQE